LRLRYFCRCISGCCRRRRIAAGQRPALDEQPLVKASEVVLCSCWQHHT
jgi:hypothetical protein